MPSTLNPAIHATKWKECIDQRPSKWFTGLKFIQEVEADWIAEPDSLSIIKEEILGVRCNAITHDKSISVCKILFSEPERTHVWMLIVMYHV